MNAKRSPNPSLDAVYEPARFFVLRTPLLPWDAFATCSSAACGALAPDAPDDADAIERDRERVRAELRKVVRDPLVREAIFVASPSLDGRLDDWLEARSGRDANGVEPPLYRYFARMAGRCTPFGLFAGCSVGTVGGATRLELHSRRENRRRSRIDNDYLLLLVEALARDPAIRANLRYSPNTSLYRAAGRLHYAEAHGAGRGRAHRLVAVDPAPHLEHVLAKAAGGASIEELARAVVEAEPEVSLDEASAYISELIDEQLLVGDLRVPMTGGDPMTAIHARLRAVDGQVAQVQESLRGAIGMLADLDARGLGSSAAAYEAIASTLDPLPVKPTVTRLFQVDMIKPTAAATLGPEVISELLRGVQLLHALSEPASPLDEFRRRFFDRYEGSEVPLTDALDEEAGIGFTPSRSPHAEASPLLAGIVFPVRGSYNAPWSARSAWLLSQWERALRTGTRELEIAPAELAHLATLAPPLPLPDAFQVLGTLAAKSAEDVARGDFKILVQGFSGPSGATTLGRFCHADPALEQAVRGLLRAEEALRPEAIFAEIVHLPYGRVGNIIARPSLREHEIEYLGASGVPAEQRIPISDLMLSLQNGRLVLSSKRLGREVVVRLTSAHNYQGGLPIYQFLCLLQHEQHSSGGSMRWGALENAAFLPRITSGRVVLSLARWHVSFAELKPLQTGDLASRVRALRELRRAIDLPRMIVVTDSDNALPVDLENALSVDSLLDLIKSRRELLITELFPAAGETVASGPDGGYRHELIVPFVRRGAPAAPADNHSAPAPKEARRPASHVPRSFPPGSEWLYAKLYTGHAGADRVLREIVAPTARAAIASGAADRFFFVRYGDPEWHVRVRFHGDARRLRAEVLGELDDRVRPLLAEGAVHKLMLDTYVREIERYGGARGMELAERFFHADSEATLEFFLAGLGGDASTRWRLVHVGMDLILSDLGFGTSEKHRLLKQVRDSFAQELGVSGAYERPLGDKYRQERAHLDAALARAESSDAAFEHGLRSLERRSERVRAVAAELRSAAEDGELTTSIESIAASYVHMFANRVLRSAARPQEFVIYDFLERAYESQLARARKAGAAPT
jgi:thiopeptide-type bacteriocin biosynthesis protein